MARKFYTILLVPEEPAKVKRVRVPKFIVKGGAILFSLLVVVTAFLLIQYLDLKTKSLEASYFRNMARVQRQELVKFSEKLGALEGRVDTLRQWDTRVRMMLNFDNKKGKGDLPGREGIPQAPPMRSSLKRDLLGALSDEFSRLDLMTRAQEKSFSELELLVRDYRIRMAAIPSIMPTSGNLSSGFGPRPSPITGEDSMHLGIDISNQIGTPVVATGDGVVNFAGYDQSRGRLVSIDHGYGYVTRYGHAKEIKVAVGQRVKRGQLIATMGNSGISTGPHVHYEVWRNGVAVNPERYIFSE